MDQDEMWRVVPPEEKFEMMARAHAAGTVTATLCIAVAGTIAVALQLGWLFWLALCCSPLTFQFAAGKVWRGLRPKAMLEYLAARSAARRYAFAKKAQDLGIQLMFRGYMKEEIEDSNMNEALTSAFSKIESSSGQVLLWIVLLNDSVVLMSEKLGGARMEFGQLINDKISIEATGKEYSNERVVFISCDDHRKGRRKYRITSPYPAALNVFEKRLLSTQKLMNNRARDQEAADNALALGSVSD